MDYSMGLPDSILSLINKTPEGDGFVDASGCINNLQIGTNEFMFDINMKELADNYDLGKLVISLASTLVVYIITYMKNVDMKYDFFFIFL